MRSDGKSPTSGNRLSVLHLTGARADDGGILSVLRALQEATASAVSHRVWVQEGFQQTRTPSLDLIRSRHALDETPGALTFLLRALRAWPELKRLLLTNPDWIVHAHTRGTFPLAAWLSRSRPVLFTQHAYARRTGMYRRVASWPRMRTLLLTPAMARHYGIPEQPGKVDIVSECALDRWFQSPLPERRRPDAGRPLKVVGLGNLVRWKRWDLALGAVALLPESVREQLQLEIWGPTPPDEDARRFAASLRERLEGEGLSRWITLRGPTTQPAGVMSGADAFLLPSTNEPCSVALIEALASGVPVLASRSGGNPDLIREGATGLLFEPDSAASLATQLTVLVTGRATFDSPERVRESVTHRAASVVGARHLELYQELAAARFSAFKASAAG
jgi:glycosyltransferase involved in cell wall biosynthesis